MKKLNAVIKNIDEKFSLLTSHFSSRITIALIFYAFKSEIIICSFYNILCKNLYRNLCKNCRFLFIKFYFSGAIK